MSKCLKCNSSGIFLKLNKDGVCINCLTNSVSNLTNENVELKALIPADSKALLAIRNEHDKVSKEVDSLKSKIEKYEGNIKELTVVYDSLKKSSLVLQDNLEMEDFSLYISKHPLNTVEEFKNKLTSIRDSQKNLIKSDKAATCSISWTVDGSASKGRKQTKDNIKLVLKAFNSECDTAINSVKFNNFERCKLRIEKSFSAINKLQETNRITISKTFLNLKIQELEVVLEYQMFKEKEKERLRDLRAEEREAAKVAKELEESRKQALRDKAHYDLAIEKLILQIEQTSNPEDILILNERLEELTKSSDDLAHKLEDIDYRQSNQRAGYVYIASNIGAFGEGIYKIGMTRRLDPMDRIYELGDASVPFNFDVHAMIFSEDAPTLENILHKTFDKERINQINYRREYFKVDLELIKKTIIENHDKTVEFFDVPEAQQYRESLIISKRR